MLELLKMKASPDQIDFKNKGNRWGAAKNQLAKESHNKCAYCEADTRVVAHGDVEHYRPKSKYWWLAYCYDNYLFSCQICNQSFKGNNFLVGGNPLQEPKLPANASENQLKNLAGSLGVDPLDQHAVEQFMNETRKERAHIPDPYDPEFDPDALFVWEEDEDNQCVRLNGKGNTARAKRTLKVCEDHLGLNREELLRLRWRTFSTLRTFRDVLERLEDEFGVDDSMAHQIRDEIAKMMSDKAQYAQMVRFYVGTKWKLDIPLSR